MSLGARTSQCREAQLVQSRRRYYILRQLGIPESPANRLRTGQQEIGNQVVEFIVVRQLTNRRLVGVICKAPDGPFVYLTHK